MRIGHCLKKYVSLAGGVILLLPATAFAQWNVGMATAQQSNLPRGSIYLIILTLMNWLLAILGFIGIIAFVIAGMLYLTAAGDDDRISQAKTAMRYSIIGIIVALIGFVIIQAVNSLLGAGFFFFI